MVKRAKLMMSLKRLRTTVGWHVLVKLADEQQSFWVCWRRGSSEHSFTSGMMI